MTKTISSLLVWFLSVLTNNLLAQKETPFTFTDAKQLTLIGKALSTDSFFHRIDTAAFPGIPPAVKRLLTHSAGLAISFVTNSSQIAVKWCTSPQGPGNNLTAIAQEGMDLYIKRNGQWQYAGVARPSTHQCNEFTVVQHMPPGDKECLLYLPLYDETFSVQGGVETGAGLTAKPNPF